MVTSTQQPDKKVVKMEEQNSSVVVPQRTLLGEVNEHITCPLCRGYYIDATTIVECLHSFCRSCIIKHLQAKSYCPVCEMMINSAKPNIKLDKALQDIVYKLVPGLFQKEMERRQQFYASRPGPAATATPEQRGEDTERIIFSPEDVISFSLEYSDVTDTDSISSKSSDSNESQPSSTSRRYLQCPAVVNINHLKKFLSMKFDIDSTQFAIDILYKRVPLPDYYTLMDIAYIYNWKRNEPMRFFYQIIDYVAIRNRLFDINRKSICPFGERKSSPAPTEDTNASSPTPHLNEPGSEASSGTDSPMLDERPTSQMVQNNDKVEQIQIEHNEINFTNQPCLSPKKNDDEVEKSQFLNSFELTAKSNCLSKISPVKSDQVLTSNETLTKLQVTASKADEKVGETSKRKYQIPPQTPELKKLRVEIEKAKIANANAKSNTSPISSLTSPIVGNKVDNILKSKESEEAAKKAHLLLATQNVPSPSEPTKEAKLTNTITTSRLLESPGVKRTVTGSPAISSPKRKPPNEIHTTMQPPTVQRTVSPLKLPIPKPEITNTNMKPPEVQKQTPPIKKMPDLKPSVPMSQPSQNKGQPVNKIRMDLLANNSDFTKPKSSLGSPSVPQTSGDPLKSLFDSCKINIPSSLSITLTEQKQEARNLVENVPADPKKNLTNKNLTNVSNSPQHKVPSPSVHNYIEILKLPDTESKKPSKPDGNVDVKSNQPTKSDNNPAQPKPPAKSSETSAKGPIPNLKPIADTKLAKQSGNFSAPITFQQTFEQQLQTMQCDKKPKGPKNKAQVPKLVPATPKSFNVVNKPTPPVTKSNPISMPILENKPSTALDLSTPHNIQNQLLTMQSIDNLAKKQNLPNKGIPLPQTNVFPSSHRTLPAGVNPLRIPTTPNMNLIKSDKSSPSGSPLNNRHDIPTNKSHPLKPASNVSPSILSPSYQVPSHSSPSTAQPSPRSQTRSPSSSPKLVIAEEKQASSSTSEQNMNQSNQISSTQIPNLNPQNNDLQKITPGPTKVLPKPMTSTGKMSGVRQPLPTNLKPTPNVLPSAEYLMSQTRPQLMAHSQNMMQLRHQMEMNAWAQRQIDIYKNMAHQIQNEFNNKDKQQ